MKPPGKALTACVALLAALLGSRLRTPSEADELRAQFERYGFIVVPNLLPADVMQDLRSATAELELRAQGLAASNGDFDLEPSSSSESVRIRRIKDPTRQHPAFDNLTRNDALLTIVDRLFGGHGVRFQGDKLNMKLAGDGSAVHWHQDFSFYPHTNDALLAVGIPLDDMSAFGDPDRQTT